MSAPVNEDPMPFSVMTAIEDIPKTAPPFRGNPLLRYLRPERPANDNQAPDARPPIDDTPPTTE